MSRLDVSIRGLRLEERSRRSQGRQRLLEAFAVLLLAALATGYSRERMAPAAVLSTIADFGPQQVGQQSAMQRLVLRNRGRSELRVGDVGISGEGAAVFFIPEESCGNAALAAGESCAVGVAFVPQKQGPSTATLTVADNTAQSPHVVVLRGTGIGEIRRSDEHADPGIEPREAALSADVGSTATQQVTVRNSGNAPLNLMEVSFSGDAGNFAIDSSGCAGGPIAPAGSCTLLVAFTPQRAGPQTATLKVVHDAPVGPLLLSLQGQGIGPPEGFCCIGVPGQIVALDAVACSERKGEFALDAAALEGRCGRRYPLPLPAPEKLTPGGPDENEPQRLPGCAKLVLAWAPVSHPSEPVEYLVTLENGRGKRGAERPSAWGEVVREAVPATQLDVAAAVASILDPKPQNPREMVAPPPARRIDPRLLQERIHVPPIVSLPEFRWRVSARDTAGNESPASEWMYFSCGAEYTFYG